MMSGSRQNKVHVLVAEDSPVIRQLLVASLRAAPGVVVVGEAADGREVVEKALRLRPDVIAMDINLPVMNACEATHEIMRRCPAPVVVLSGGRDRRELAAAFKAIEAGAVAVLPRLMAGNASNLETASRELVRTMKLAPGLPIPKARLGESTAAGQTARVSPSATRHAARLVALGGSLGGPLTLLRILTQLPAPLPVPLLVVQHLSPEFLPEFVDWLAKASNLPVELAVHGQTAQAGVVYVAPADRHLEVRPGHRLAITEAPPEGGRRPSISRLFRSVAEHYGPWAVTVLLAGESDDGFVELRLLRSRGAVAIVQAPESPASAGAFETGSHVLDLPEIAALLAAIELPPGDRTDPGEPS
jgi:two-component system, chemotaxis family, protein-glutamate methylesterase/glutaminase